jgi:oligopeptide/dipeptide ABC transporter ATP-binding protein
MTDRPLLSVEGLRVAFATEDGLLQAVDGVSFSVAQGEVLAVVGESGSGKSVTAMTLMGLTQGANTRVEGKIEFDGDELSSLYPEEWQAIRGGRMAMVFQDPMTALNPVQRVGDQIVEQIRAHERKTPKAAAYERAVGLMERVGIPGAARRARAFPHELSGGMRQRVMIAMALSCKPKLLIADEPTTALDVSIQAQILAELRDLREDTGLALIMVTHDLGVVADIAERVAVMYAGRIVEHGTLDQLFYDPQHPYTWGLLGSIARVDQPRPHRLPAIPGAPPSLLDPPTGCRFRPRCPHAFEACANEPALLSRSGATGHLDRCWLPAEDKRERRQVEGRIGLATRGTVIA